MSLFSISGGSLSPIKLLSLNREKDMQIITEKNLEKIGTGTINTQLPG